MVIGIKKVVCLVQNYCEINPRREDNDKKDLHNATRDSACRTLKNDRTQFFCNNSLSKASYLVGNTEKVTDDLEPF